MCVWKMDWWRGGAKEGNNSCVPSSVTSTISNRHEERLLYSTSPNTYTRTHTHSHFSVTATSVPLKCYCVAVVSAWLFEQNFKLFPPSQFKAITTAKTADSLLFIYLFIKQKTTLEIEHFVALFCCRSAVSCVLCALRQAEHPSAILKRVMPW